MSHEIIENDNAIAHLPIELFVEILSYLPEKGLKVFKRVCKYWRDNLDTHFSLYGKFLPMQRWHTTEIDNTIKELERFKDRYPTITYRNIYFRGSFDTIFSLYLSSFLSVIASALLMTTLYYINKTHNERPI